MFPVRSETFVYDHVVGLRGRGHDVTVVSRSLDETVSKEEIDRLNRLGVNRIYVGEFGYPKLNLLKLAIRALRDPIARGLLRGSDYELRRRVLVGLAEASVIRRIKPDIVHFHFGDHASYFFRFARDAVDDSKCIVTWHGYDFNAHAIVQAQQGYRCLAGRHVTHTIGTKFARDKLVQFGFSDGQLRLIPLGIDLGRFEFRRRSYQSGEVLRMLCVGRLVEVKGHRILLSALSQLISRERSLVLRIAGDGPMLGELGRLASSLGISNNVQFLGSVTPSQVVNEMHNAHLFALTGVRESSGKEENQGMVYFEAQATGLPVIGSNVGGVPEAMIDGRSGLLCPETDVDAVCRAIEYFIDNPEKVGEFGAAGRVFAERKVSIDQMLDQFEDLYESCLSNGGPPD